MILWAFTIKIPRTGLTPLEVALRPRSEWLRPPWGGLPLTGLTLKAKSYKLKPTSMDKEVLAKIKSGATVRVYEKVKEGDKERLAQFEGLVLARKHGSEPGATFTVRAMVAGVGVEKIFPIHSPKIEKVVILSSPRKVSRSKLYYLRTRSAAEIRKKLGSAK